MNLLRNAHPLLAGLLFGSVNAAMAAAPTPTIEALQACGNLDVAKQLDCFRREAGLPPINAPVTAVAPPDTGSAPKAELPQSRLDTLWTPAPDVDGKRENRGVFSQYKQSYLLATYTHSPNNEAHSPTRSAVVREEGPYDTREGKFLFSFKSLVAGNERHSLWGAYSQQSHWQVFDGEHSRSFRASDYEPEAIYSYRFSDAFREKFSLGGMTPRMLNIGFVHQSNGEPLPQSRSWNRLYARLGLEKTWQDGTSFAIQIRPWWRIPERPSDNDNPDLTKYLGYGDLEMRYWWSRESSLSLIARKRSAQIDFAFPFGIPGLFSCKLMQWHLHYFNGYGESLIDYNQRHRTIGLGISIPYPGSSAGNTCR
ncbi:phospholipase A [Viridibacterium curvum]|uniref:Phospholipase A1 n=1 Tax=Viridibacterium curvum TaxID=1101404 RepID=A0ABP9Q9Y1_9RHOO